MANKFEQMESNDIIVHLLGFFLIYIFKNYVTQHNSFQEVQLVQFTPLNEKTPSEPQLYLR